MSSLFGVGSQQADTALPTPTTPSEQKRPGVAFLLSLLFPGLGHVYCRKFTHAALTAGFFTASSCFFIFSNASRGGMFWGYSLRVALVLYMFGFLDAYYTAREINAGISQYIVGNNPRIAAMLNLLTNGFGYFYLGERKKGLICFFALRIFSAAGKGSDLLVLCLEVALIAIAVDAYKVARGQLHDAFPEQPVDPFAIQGGLSPWVPAALGVLFVFNYVVLVILGLMLPRYEPLDQQQSVIDNQSIPRTYKNPKYGVELRAPEGWDVKKGDAPFMVEAQTRKGGCSAGVIPASNVSWRGLIGDSHVVADEILKQNKGFQMLSEKPAELNGRRAYQMVFAAKFNQVEVIQRYIITEPRLSIYALVETFATSLADQCQADFDNIERGLVLPR